MRVRYDGIVITTMVVFGDRDIAPLPGAYALEGLGVAADPVNRLFVSAPGLLIADR